jgi:hypothetical protein
MTRKLTELEKLNNYRRKHDLPEITQLGIDHSNRFRQVCSGYAHAVSSAYKGDHAAAAAATDDEVEAKVREWEIAQGLKPTDYYKFGWEEEGRSEPDAYGHEHHLERRARKRAQRRKAA